MRDEYFPLGIAYCFIVLLVLAGQPGLALATATLVVWAMTLEKRNIR